MSKQTPIPCKTVDKIISEAGSKDVGRSRIREINKLINDIEEASGLKYIRMEMGVPGLEPVSVAVEAEIQALRRGVASKYPDIEGVPALKKKISRICKLYLDIDVNTKR